MPMWIEWTIATRFLREGKSQSTLILVGIAVGVAVIVFLTALITGLQGNIVNRTLGTQAHIKVQPTEEANRVLAPADGSVHLVLESKRAQRLRSINNWQQVRDVLDALPRVTAVSPVISGPAFARRGEALESVALVGIDAARYQRIIPIADDIVAGRFRIGAGEAVVGSQLARDLGLRVGDKLRLDGGQGRDSVVNVAGIFELGVRELDARYVYLDMKQAQSLLDLPGAATIIDVTVDDIFAAREVAARIARLTGLKAESWMETNAQLMNALRSQSLSTRMISVFVALSVALGIASVLSVSVVQRTRDRHPARDGHHPAADAAGVPGAGRAVRPGRVAGRRSGRLRHGDGVQHLRPEAVLHPGGSVAAGGRLGTGHGHRDRLRGDPGAPRRRPRPGGGDPPCLTATPARTCCACRACARATTSASRPRWKCCTASTCACNATISRRWWVRRAPARAPCSTSSACSTHPPPANCSCSAKPPATWTMPAAPPCAVVRSASCSSSTT